MGPICLVICDVNILSDNIKRYTELTITEEGCQHRFKFSSSFNKTVTFENGKYKVRSEGGMSNEENLS